MKNWAKYSVTIILASLIVGCTSFGKLQRKGTFEEKYAGAVEYYQNKKYYKAGVLFNDIMPFSAGRPEASEIHYMNADCQYNEGNLYYAASGFKRYYEKYPRSERVEDAMFMYAKTLTVLSPSIELDQDNSIKAINAMQAFINRYPNSEHKEECNQKITELERKIETKAYNIAKLNLQIEHYRAAVIGFKDFIQKYPNSSYNEELSFLTIKAQYLFGKNSIEKLKKDGKYHYLKRDRLRTSQTYYNNFVRKYPTSKYLNDAEQLLKQVESELSSIQ